MRTQVTACRVESATRQPEGTAASRAAGKSSRTSSRVLTASRSTRRRPVVGSVLNKVSSSAGEVEPSYSNGNRS